MRPAEIVRLVTFVLGTLKFSIDQLKTHHNLREKLKNGLEALRNDLDYLKNGLEKEGWESCNELRLTELVYDIEDFAQGLWIPETSGPVLSAIGMDPREEYVGRVEFFQKEIEKLETRQKKSPESKPEHGGGSDPASSSAPGGYAKEKSLVGISEPKKLLLNLLKKPDSREEAKKPPKVISILGCPGVGKTALASVVYDHYFDSTVSSCDFECVVWVEAAGCNDETVLLGKILQKVEAGLPCRANLMKKGKKTLAGKGFIRKVAGHPSEDGNAASKKLSAILANMRYLVFIDDVQQATVLKKIVDNHFPKNAKSGMVIVTTSVRQVADVCSSGSYVYTMKCLGHTESKNLLCRQAFKQTPEDVSPANGDGLERIITKCGGLPLALISVAEYLSIKNPTRSIDIGYLKNVAKELGSKYLAGHKEEEKFKKLRRALGQCYEGLPNYDHKTYMRYLSIFPGNHPIKFKLLERRLVAEGLVAGDDRECFDELVNRCIVEPVHNGKDVKNFKVDVGIMLEFIICMSLFTNFITLIREEEVVRNPDGRIRRLSVQSSTKRDKFQEVAQGKETIRSLTVFPSEGTGEILKIVESCKFLRLLDLEGCMGLDEEFFSGICKLVYLKYLSLRRTDVKKIPQQINNLLYLQTLDIRDTQMMELPEEVINMPELAYLFGKFVLPEMCNNTREFLEGGSKLHTVAGFVVEQWKGPEQIILKAENLKKVKVWCRDTSNIGFVLSLRNIESVSIESDQLSTNIMASQDESLDVYRPDRRPCIISRMKLSGILARLPYLDTLKNIKNLNKLQLSCTGLTSEGLVVLQHMERLQYLKLHDDKERSWDDTFHVSAGGFQSLLLLCFRAKKLPTLKFDEGSMRNLTSLQLFCQNISRMQVADDISENIKHITTLNDVILDSSATTEMVEAWKTAAMSNPRRPCVTTSTCS